MRAWDESIPWLQRECRELVGAYDAARSYTAILEYELPRESPEPVVHRLDASAPERSVRERQRLNSRTERTLR